MNMEPLKLACNRRDTAGGIGEDGSFTRCDKPANHEVRSSGHEGPPIVRCDAHLQLALAAARELFGTAVAYRYVSKQFTRWGWVEVRDE